MSSVEKEIVCIGHIEIKVKKLTEADKYTVFGGDKNSKNFNYMWEHYSGLGFLHPNYGYASTYEEAISQARDKIKSAKLI